MRFLIILFLFFYISNAVADQFEMEARELAKDLKVSLMKNLSEKMAKDGPLEAIPFCHANVKPIAKEAAKKRASKYEFGRTSHKTRNPENAPQPWMQQYIKEFEGKKKGEVEKTYIIHKLVDSKRVYLEPLYIEAKCLNCHGDNVSKNVLDKVQELYPKDQATGFKLGEFRGFIWIKEK